MEPFRLELVEPHPAHTSPKVTVPEKPYSGLAVPDVPVAPVGCFYSYDTWWKLLDPSTFKSADRAGVFTMERLGPRKGQWFAVQSAEGWLAWATKYKARVLMREMHEVARRLGYDHKVKRAR